MTSAQEYVARDRRLDVMLRAGAREAVRQMARCGVTTLGAAAPTVSAGAAASASRAEAGPRRGCAAVLERARGFAAGSAPSMGHGHGHGAPSDAETIAVTFHEKDGSETTVRVRRSSRLEARVGSDDRSRASKPPSSSFASRSLFFRESQTAATRRSKPLPRPKASVPSSPRGPLGRPPDFKKLTACFTSRNTQAAIGHSMLEVAHRNDIELEGACEGSLACSTCHVIIDDQAVYDALPEPDDDENDMLDLAFGLTETSRLGCQVIAAKELDGMTLSLPRATRNFAVDGFVPKPH
jgi:ferredoxin